MCVNRESYTESRFLRLYCVCVNKGSHREPPRKSHCLVCLGIDEFLQSLPADDEMGWFWTKCR